MQMGQAFKVLVTSFLIFCSCLAFASNPKELVSIKGFSAGMELEEVKKALDEKVEFYEMIMPDSTIKLGYYSWSLGECKKRSSFLKVCKDRVPASLTIGGVTINHIQYYPESKTIEFLLGDYDYSKAIPLITHKSYSDAQTLARYLTSQHELDWETSNVDCSAYGCVEERSLHQGNGRFITVGVGDGGTPKVFIKLSVNSGEIDTSDF